MILEHAEVRDLFKKYIDTGFVFPAGVEVANQWTLQTGEGDIRSFFYSDHDSNFELSIQSNDGDVSDNILHIIFIMNDVDTHSKLIVSSDVVSDANYSNSVSNENALVELNSALIVFKNLNVI
ncbi:hypothetical protein [Serratia symbiotica]|uniref:hypothetical protein n=1 Tax=Serratia symbiotica TaxID=138074 RepID=UPI00132C6C47|nr:hypothetical protein [Serratia symbiotica]QTP13365.1 hypothetical protein GPZ83_0000050 [Serratia symbiotica]